MIRFDVEAAVIGAGVVGLAIGFELSRRGVETTVLEKNAKIAQETSARHSGVIHAGLYYPTGSLKAAMCVEGRRRLYDFCREHGVSHAKVGKLIVAATPAEEAGLGRLLAQGQANDVEGLRLVSQAEARRREPNVTAVAGLLSAATGIVNSDELAAALERRILDRGGTVLVGQEVVGLEQLKEGWRVEVRPSRGEAYAFTSRIVVISAGLWSDRVAGLAGVGSFKTHFCKGDYFWTTKPVVKGLVYPLPEKNLKGLGVHTTVDLAGRVRFGPDATYVEQPAYQVDETKAAAFHAAVARYLQGLSVEDLKPDTAGVRPKLSAEGEEVRDFRVSLDKPGLACLAGIESPGLTSCLALAREVAAMLSVEAA